MANNSSTTSAGVGFFNMLGIVFIALKLLNAINWSWWLVLLPIYGSFAIAIVILIIAILIAIA